MSQLTRRRALDQLYELLACRAQQVGGTRRLGSCTGRHGWPSHGLYLIFEPGELREDGATPRIVRVGTHALTAAAKTTLWTRLRAHRGNVGGRNPGGGNHRGSVFRLHVGHALLVRDGDSEAEPTWGHGTSAPHAVRTREGRLERAVSAYVAEMELLWLNVPNREDRSAVERALIGLLSNAGRSPVDSAGADWLGHHSPHPAIRASGLWNVNHVHEPADPAILEAVRRLVG